MPLEPLSTPSEILTMHWELKAAAVHASQGLKDRIDRRLRFALSRFEGRVDHVVVFLQSLNGPKGGIDKSVRILARIDGVGIVLAMVIDSGWEVAVDRAADRIGVNVAHQLIRHRQRSSRAYGTAV
jgi:hypothetical protein